MIDPIHDSQGKFLYQKTGSTLDENFAEELRADASVYGPEAFADPSARRFPIFSEKAAGASAIYASLQDVPADVEERIKEACDLFNIDVELPQEKTASAPDKEDFLFPEHQKVLVTNGEQVKTAEAALRERHDDFDVMTRTFAYRRLQEKAATFGVTLSPESVRYCAESRCHVPSLCSAIQRRRKFVYDPQQKLAFAHLEHALRDMRVEHIDDDGEKDKLAQLLFDMDQEAAITERYNRPGDLGFPDPVLAVFNTDKTAADFINMAGHEVPMDQVSSLDPELLGDIVGGEFMDDIVGPDGQVDPNELAQTLSILPSDMQQEIVQRLHL